MAITDIDISEKLIGDAPSIKYEGDMRTDRSTPPWERENPWDEDPKDQVIDEETTIRVASEPSWEDEWEQIYQNYKAKQIKLEQEFVTKDEFMEDYQYASGGRVNFGLGSLFKSVGKAAKKFVKSPIGKAALLGLGAYGTHAGWFGPKSWQGWGSKIGPALFGTPGGIGTSAGIGGLTGAGPSAWTGAPLTKGLLGKWGLTKGAGSMMPTALGWGTAAVAGGMGAQMFENMQPDDIKALRNNPDALRNYLKMYHTNTHPDKTEKEVDIWVEQNMYSTGGRVGLRGGGRGPDWFTVRVDELMAGGMSETAAANQAHEEGPGGQGTRRAEGGRIEFGIGDWAKKRFHEYTAEGRDEFKGEWLKKKDLDMSVQEWNDLPLKEKIKIRMREGNATGGRTGFAFGPDQTAEAAGIMGQLPVRNNSAGVKELDLRDSGGFIPPVGVKEKADDIPAMLSNNEFVFTADAVKAAGGGSVEKGAQVMYDQMKNLENRVA